MIKIPVDETVVNLATSKLEIEIDGEPVTLTIHAFNSPKMIKPIAAYRVRLEHAKANDIELTEKVEIDCGMGVTKEVEQQTQWALENAATMIGACVEGFPEDKDIVQEMLENPDFCMYVEAETLRLQNDFLAKKKS